jgi:DME family drug/metabolite transporter
MQAAATARTQILIAAALFSTGGAAIKACELNAWQIACLRSLLAAVALAALLPSARRGLSARAALVGLAYAATVLLFVLSTKLTTAANAIFLQSTAPLYLLLLGPWLLRERVRARDLACMLAIAVGLGLFFVEAQAPQHTAPDPATGNLLAAGSGIAWAFTVLGLRWLGQTQAAPRGGDPALAAVVLGNAFAALLAAPQAWPLGDVRPVDWAVVLFLGWVQIALAYWFATRGLQRVAAFEASLLFLLEPALSPLWAYLVHGERLSGLALLGGVWILAATVVRALLERRQRA